MKIISGSLKLTLTECGAETLEKDNRNNIKRISNMISVPGSAKTDNLKLLPVPYTQKKQPPVRFKK
jgi:hypothetical protein